MHGRHEGEASGISANHDERVANSLCLHASARLRVFSDCNERLSIDNLTFIKFKERAKI